MAKNRLISDFKKYRFGSILLTGLIDPNRSLEMQKRLPEGPRKSIVFYICALGALIGCGGFLFAGKFSHHEEWGFVFTILKFIFLAGTVTCLVVGFSALARIDPDGDDSSN